MLKGDLTTLKRLADARGVKALAYFAGNTTQETLDVAIEVLGKNNVFVFEDPTPKDYQRLLQQYQKNLGGN